MTPLFSVITHHHGTRHLTRSIALEEAATPGLLYFGAMLIGILMALFLIWSACATVEEIAVATGQVMPSGYIQDIQHPDGGVVREILAQEDELVEQGQPLIRLDATNANADLGQMRARQTALQLQAARLRIFTGSTASDHKLNADGQAILDSMKSARASQINVAHDQIAQKEKELSALTASRQALVKNVALKKEQYTIYQKSLQNGSVSKVMVMGVEQELNQLQGQLSEAIIQEHRGRDAISEAQNHLQSIDSELTQNAMKDLGTIEGELAELNKSIGKQEGAASRTTLVAPVRGIVKGLTVHTLGAVVEPGKLILQIVPVGEELVVETLVAPTDIGTVKPGEEVKVKVSAFDFSRYGSLSGHVVTVSASTFQDKHGQSFYRARIKLDRNYVGQNAGMNLILPGMTVQANIITGHKTILDYLLKPLHVAAETALHER